MKKFMFAILLFAATGLTSVGADELFPDCSDVVDDPDYRALKQYFSKNKVGPSYCQRLNDQEFMYTDQMTINYCRLSQGDALTCESDLYPNLEIAKRFAGSKGKKFVLFHVSRLSHGIFGEGYHAFFLVPKRISVRGYMLFFFPNAGAGDNNDGSGECNEDDKKEITIALDPHFEILNENQSNVGIRFNQEKIDCSTGSKAQQKLEYTWQPFGYQLTRNQITKLPITH